MGFSSTLMKAAVMMASSLMMDKAVLVIAKSVPIPIPVQFNPSEYRISERTNFSEVPRRKKDEPVMNFNGKPLSTLNVKLYFDCDEATTRSDSGDGVVSSVVNSVQDLINDISIPIGLISSLTVIDGESHQPPGAIFVWGSLQFVGFAENVGVTYTMFNKGGKPLRAIVDLTLIGSNGLSSEKMSPMMSPDRTKARTMTEDNNIWNMAQKEYGDVREWRRIADANGIMNPLDIPVGKILRVPSIDDR